MGTVTFGKTLCGTLVFACIAVGAACQQRSTAANAITNTNATPNTNTTSQPTPGVTEQQFKGISDQGDFNEALKNAINAAHESLQAHKVAWRLEELSGVHGGFTPPRNRITVTIRARVGEVGDQ